MRSAITIGIAALAFTVAAIPTALPAQILVLRVAPGPGEGPDDLHFKLRFSYTLLAQQKKFGLPTGFVVNLYPHCATVGPVITEIKKQPKHGQVNITDSAVRPKFVPIGEKPPRSGCNLQMPPGREVFYTPDASFRGRDTVVLQNSNSDGRIWHVIVDIEVQ